MRIGWAVPSDDKLASYRYRCAIPMRELSRMGVYVGFGMGDVTVFSKHWFPIGDLETCPSKIVFDMCDDHFGGKWDEYYRRAIDRADVVTCSTERLAQRVIEETGITPQLVSDPYEFPRAEPAIPSGKVENLFWFGHPTNVPALNAELDRLDGYRVLAISDSPGMVPWSMENMLIGFGGCDAVILPIEDKPKKMCKSPNRMVEAIRQGRYVVANPMPAYAPYGMWIGDIRQGLDFMKHDPHGALESVRMAQDIVEQMHAPAVIGKRWKEVFQCL